MTPQTPLLGFLTITENVRYGFIGGFLVLNTSGRPLEFHCTAPVRASRAQEILYGVTLKTFLCGEQIAPALIQRSKNTPELFLTDNADLLAVQNVMDVTIVYVRPEHENQSQIRISHSDTEETNHNMGFSEKRFPEINGNSWETAEIQGKCLGIPDHPRQPRQNVFAQLETLSKNIDFLEPFERIRLALEEAQRAA